jgi:hypothetical protein
MSSVEKHQDYLESLAYADLGHHLFKLATLLERCCNTSQPDVVRQSKRSLTSVHKLPVVEHTLGERLSRRMRTELTVETERLVDW